MISTEKDGGQATTMSLRDYFAAAALTGLCAAFNEPADAAPVAASLAEDAYLLADAMLKARQVTP